MYMRQLINWDLLLLVYDDGWWITEFICAFITSNNSNNILLLLLLGYDIVLGMNALNFISNNGDFLTMLSSNYP